MQSNTDIKQKISKVVGDYKKLFPIEYQATIDWIADVKTRRRKKFAELLFTGFFERKLGEIPTSLFNMIQAALTDEEKTYFLEGEESKKINRWFFGKFKEFKVTFEI